MESHFSPDYATARSRFIEAVERAHGRLHALPIQATGPKGERLTIDIAWFGSDNPRRIFVHSSGLHGVEGFAGSAIQLQWLEEGIAPLPEDGAILIIHVLNPYGMAWLRRFNENNVDLNRNFLGPDEQFVGAPAGFERLDSFLNPKSPPSPDLFYARAAWLIVRYGLTALKQTTAGGQYVNPRGLFFGGRQLEEGPAKLQAFLTTRLTAVERVVAVDIHTGLGPFAEDRLLVDDDVKRLSEYRTLRAAFGERVQPLDPGRGVAFQARGVQHFMYFRQFPQAQVYFATQEFGTYWGIKVLEALRAENRWHHYGGGSIEHRTKTKLRHVFGPENQRWREAILRRGREVVHQASALAFGK